ncbi:MAG: DUF5103 domain-containing protein [Muribaculaceae bacterium]|nr:DUF5103 domain-containing protein [Muribaculaceae bacterium]
MRALKRILLAAVLTIPCTCTIAAAPAGDTMTGIFDEHIRSLQVKLDGDDFAMPVVVLDSDDRIRISFDHIAEDREYFRYSLIHCNASWRPSGLVDSEFLDGFNEGTVDDYDFSRGTTVHYVHYSLTIPNEQVRPTLSGNYLLRIYPESDPDSTLLQCRFMISEETAPVAVRASTQTDVDYNKAHQQLSIMVDTERAQVEDPFNDLIVVAGQNGRLDSEVAFRQPLRAQGSKVIFEHQPVLIFDAGNEYRRFEIVSDTYPGMGVERIEYYDPYYHYSLLPDASRAGESYSYDQTQHGRYFVRNYNSSESDIEADYGVVHFSLDYPETPGAMIFIDGDFVQRRFDDNARMFYNHATGRYERAMLLKQGAYNYQYLIVPPGARRGYTSAIEGDKYQTVNEYTVRVYHRRRGERYDRLIGTGATRGW